METYQVTNVETGGKYICKAENPKAARQKTNWPKRLCRVDKVSAPTQEPDSDEKGD